MSRLTLTQYALEGRGHVIGPENRDVRLRRRTEIVEGVEHAIAALGHQCSAVQIHAAHAFGRPVGVTTEQRIIIGGAQEADDAELLHQLIQESLRAAFVENPALQIAFDIDVQECRDAANRHRSAVGFLDGAEIGEISPLKRVMCVRGRLRYVTIVKLCHRSEVPERAHLLG